MDKDFHILCPKYIERRRHLDVFWLDCKLLPAMKPRRCRVSFSQRLGVIVYSFSQPPLSVISLWNQDVSDVQPSDIKNLEIRAASNDLVLNASNKTLKRGSYTFLRMVSVLSWPMGMSLSISAMRRRRVPDHIYFDSISSQLSYPSLASWTRSWTAAVAAIITSTFLPFKATKQWQYIVFFLCAYIDNIKETGKNKEGRT